MEFEWDAAKAKANRTKRGVSFDEATEVFGSVFAITAPDYGHPDGEQRERTIGMTGRSRLLVVISTR